MMRAASGLAKRSSPPFRRRFLSFLALLAAVAASGCIDLDVVNYNDADTERVLATPEDVESLISASFHTWFDGSNSRFGPGLFLSNQAFQHNAPWANHGMEEFGRLPRVAQINDVTGPYYGNLTSVWYSSYGAMAAVSDGLRALEDPEVAGALGSERVTRLRAFGRFVHGLALATVAVLYDRGFAVDENTDRTEVQDPLDYDRLLEVALGYFDEATGIAGSASFSIPFQWMRADLTSQDLARLIRSYRARFRAQVARTEAERAAVDWDTVIADVDAGIQSTHLINADWTADWYYEVLNYSTWPSWNQLAYFIYGMADQSGDVAEWLSLPLLGKSPFLSDGSPVLIVTPDLRFPQGATVEEQRGNGGTHFRIASGSEAGDTWKKPERGTWRWSWYKAGPRGLDYTWVGRFDQPEIHIAEMRLLKAEGLYRKGDLAGAAAIINETRTVAGLSATDASGTNTSCVPRLPNGSCGDLWEMLKWEKRMETVWTGLAGANWFFDGRGWGDLWKNTPLMFPLPCTELQLLQLLPCDSYGGPEGEWGAPTSTYSFPFEG